MKIVFENESRKPAEIIVNAIAQLFGSVVVITGCNFLVRIWTGSFMNISDLLIVSILIISAAEIEVQIKKINQ